MAPSKPERPYVLAVGAANMDIAGTTGHALVPGDSIPGQIRCAPGGVARNVAENLARLGHGVCLLSVVGDDPFGRSLLETARSAGVATDACGVLADAATSTYLSLHGPDGDMALAVNDMAILERITPGWLAPHAHRVAGAAALLLDCNLSEDALAWLFRQARGVPVFVDPVSAFKSRRLLPWLAGVHTLKVNRIEAQALCGNALDSDKAVRAAASWLHAQGVRNLVLSLGARGAYWSTRAGTSGWQPGARVEAVHATGAGDALMAGVLHGHLTGMPLPEAVFFATGCAAMTLAVVQANHPGLSVASVRQLLGVPFP